ncbi:hypothetical protein [Wolbachia endosymbiont of Cardiocondyla obscurior]|uniref:hypothetical protein n=1 Tax=Wolbachia endosymbiont of Cardiocondyla obscurior TaxID=2687307 RepID=UPI00157A4EBA|nr:hypothetical protein [Wolbachia endosymbiont of Cardiocondyla obscurior]
MKNIFIKANAPFLIGSALASLILLTSGVFTVAPYVAFLAPIAALGIALPVILTLFVLSAVVIALSYKIISQNKKFDVKEIELNEKNRLAKEQENTIKNLETKIKELDEAKQKLGDEKNKLTQNIKELESEKVKSALENKNKIEGLETKVKELDEAKQKLEVQLSAKDLELTNIKQELENLKNEQAQKNDSGYEYLELHKENQERQTEATREGQNQKRKLISPDLGISSMFSEDDSLSSEDDSLFEEDTTGFMLLPQNIVPCAGARKFAESCREKLGAQPASDPNMQPTFRSRSSSPSGSNDSGQSDPSSKLGGVRISRSQSLNSLHSDDGDIKIDSSSQYC